MYVVVYSTIHAMAIIELVNHTFKDSQLAVAIKNAALLQAAGCKDRKESVCAVFAALPGCCALCILVTPVMCMTG